VGVPATDATDGCGQLPDRLFKVPWQIDRFTGTVVENWSDLSSQTLVLVRPQIE
jgi:hypothetical protein